MIRIKKWGGWVSYVSPYFLPAGGTVEQTNLVCTVPGEVSCRGGMKPVNFVDEDGNSDPFQGIPQELWGYTRGQGTDLIFCFTDEGSIEIKQAPTV